MSDDEVRIRNHRNRAGDADDRNDYENVRKGDDESIDDDASEVGWNSDDELAFYKPAAYYKNKSSKRKHIESDIEDDEDYEDDDLANGGMLLSDVLFQNMNKAAQKSTKSKDDDSDDESEEEDDEDSEGGDHSDGSRSENEDDEESDEDGNDDLDEVHSRLLNAIDRFAKPQAESSSSKGAGKRHNNQNSAESAFSSVVDSGDVSMSALLGALDDTRGLSVVKKHLADLEKGLAAPVHVEKVVADRIERTQVYAGSKEEMSKWHSTVVHNRHVSTLDLAHDKRQIRSFKSMVNRFEPTTDMEKEIQMVLVKHGATDEDAEQREVDELQGRNMSLQEIREKQAELAKVKALMFYEQMKRHRMNKIKSKAYRKIQKKKKAKQGEGALEDLEEEERDAVKEKEAFKRVKERMDMRHKNTSKWAKKALQYGHIDKSLRDAYHESVRLGHELTEKMNDDLQDESRRAEGSDSEGEGEEGDEEEAGAASRRETSKRASTAIKSLLAEDLADQVAPTGKYKKLFEMDFMKRAAEQQKERARDQAKVILREIEQMEEDYDSDLAAEEAAGEAAKGALVSQERLAQAKQEVKAMLGSGMAISKGRRGVMSVSTAAKTGSTGGFEFATAEESESEAEAGAEYSDEEEHRAMEAALESNPWLQPMAGGKGNKKRKAAGTGAKSSADKSDDAVMINTLAIQAAEVGGKGNKANKASSAHAVTKVTSQPASADTQGAASKKKKNKKGGDKDKETVSGVIVESSAPAAGGNKEKAAVRLSLSEGQTQADLVQMAFAGPDLEAEFRAFKQAEIDAEHGVDEKKMKILSEVKAGWGDWAGPGAGGMQISQKVLNKRDRLLTKVQQENAVKVVGRADHKMAGVMISNRRVKTASKYKISEIPHPFTSVEEYERSLQMPLGDEWNASDVVKSQCQPEIKLRPGRVIEPIKLSKKRTSAAAAAQETTRLNKPAKKAKQH